MHPKHLLLVILLAATLAACNRDQPSGIPDSPSGTSTPVPAPAEQTAPAQPQPAEPQTLAEAPPPLDGDIPPLDKTGFPDCDDFLERYRQCLNSRLAGDERREKATNLHSASVVVTSSISRNVAPERVAAQCRKSRSLVAKRLQDLGCDI